MKKTLVLGATPNPARYSFLAVRKLTYHGFEAVPLGIRQGDIDGIEILNGKPELKNIHTATIYLNPFHQDEYFDYLLNLKLQRLIFNPGAENPYFMKMAKEAGVEVLAACTLVLLSTGVY